MSAISFSIAEVVHFTTQGSLAAPGYEIKAVDGEDGIVEQISTEDPLDLVRLRDCLNIYISLHNLDKSENNGTEQ